MKKRRYEIKTEKDENGIPVLYIRATQGHSMNLPKEDEDDELLDKIEEASEVPFCIHGTYEKAWESIKSEGLKAMSGDHIRKNL